MATMIYRVNTCRLTGSLHSLASNHKQPNIPLTDHKWCAVPAVFCWNMLRGLRLDLHVLLKSVGTFHNPHVWFFDCSWSVHDRRDTFRLSLSTTPILEHRCLLRLGCPSVSLCFQSMPFESFWFNLSNPEVLKFTARHRSVTSLTQHLVT